MNGVILPSAQLEFVHGCERAKVSTLAYFHWKLIDDQRAADYFKTLPDDHAKWQKVKEKETSQPIVYLADTACHLPVCGKPVI